MQAPQVFSFHGGIHPAQNKAQSLQLPLGRPSLPSELILPLGQHIGQSSRSISKVGDRVLKGEIIAINNGFLSSYLHAPTSGTITAIEERFIAHPSGLSDLCIVLSPDGKEEWTTLNPLNTWQTDAPEDVLAHLAKMGIVGMGGAGFPTQVKLQGATKSPLTHFIINAAECEPYITADDILIREKTLELVKGIEIFQHLVNAENVVIGIEDNKPIAIAALNTLLNERGSQIQVAVVPTKYPSGGEKQLIQLITGKEVPSGQYPADIGILCQNVGTCVAVHDAILLGKPLISRITTLTGDALKSPQNVEVLLGTPVTHLLDYADSQEKKLHRLIMGGPMMGYTLDSAAVPIVKTSNCILAATKKELPTPAPEQACIRCGMCEQACPASLLPQQLLWFSKSQELDKAEHYNLFDCIECGACSYVCPSSIPLVQYYRHTKSSIRETREANVKSDLAKQRFEARKARQDAEAAEKEAKRIARQQASAAKTASAKTAPSTGATPPVTTQPTAAPISDEAKKLKIDIAIAKTKLKKRQKELLTAQEAEHLEEISSLQLQVTEQETQLASLEKEFSKIPVANTAPTAVTETSTAVAKAPVSDELKKAKVDVALVGVKIKKLTKQLDETPGNQEIKDKISSLEIDLIAAKAMVEKLTSTSISAPVTAIQKTPISNELKKAKVDVALIGVKIKKLTKQLEETPDDQETKDKIAAFETDLIAAKTAVEKLSAAPSEATPSNHTAEPKAVITDELKKLKIDTAIAKASVKKVEKALKKAEEIQAPEVDAIRQQLKEAQQRADDLEKALANPDALQLQPQSKENTEKAAAPINADADKKRKIDLAIAKAGIKKAEKNILLLKEQGKDEAEIIASEWPAKLIEAQAKLENLESQPSPEAQLKANIETQALSKTTEKATENADIQADLAAQIKKQKIASALAKAQINKLAKRLESTPEEADSIQQEIDATRIKQQDAETLLAQLIQSKDKQENH
ncbi:MAG: electron transport complex subunit RsxC [Marinomonas colpomeniae]